MNPAFKPVLVVGLVVLGMAGFMIVSKHFEPKELIPWRTDYAAAEAEAHSANKPLFLYFTASWCGPCQKMKTSTWADAEVDAALKKYVPVKLDIDAHADLAAKYAVDSIPAFRVLNEKNELVKSDAGYVGAKEFVEWLK